MKKLGDRKSHWTVPFTLRCPIMLINFGVRLHDYIADPKQGWSLVIPWEGRRSQRSFLLRSEATTPSAPGMYITWSLPKKLIELVIILIYSISKIFLNPRETLHNKNTLQLSDINCQRSCTYRTVCVMVISAYNKSTGAYSQLYAI